MSKFVWVALIIAFLTYRWIPPLKERNVLVLVETSGTYGDKLPEVRGLKAAFHIIEKFDVKVAKDQTAGNVETKVR